MKSNSQRQATDCGIIEARLPELEQLFDALDPSPFRAQDLHRSVEEYVVESARELPSRSAYALIIHLDQPADIAGQGDAVGVAIRSHFDRRVKRLRRDLRQLLRRGAISLAIGTVFLAAFFMLSHLVSRIMGESTFATLLREGSLIAGWVAMWRPLEIFLYDWWPIVGERRLYERLSRMTVQIVDPERQLQTPAARTLARALSRWENEGGQVPGTAPASVRGWPRNRRPQSFG